MLNALRMQLHPNFIYANVDVGWRNVHEPMYQKTLLDSACEDRVPGLDAFDPTQPCGFQWILSPFEQLNRHPAVHTA